MAASPCSLLKRACSTEENLGLRIRMHYPGSSDRTSTRPPTKQKSSQPIRVRGGSQYLRRAGAGCEIWAALGPAYIAALPWGLLLPAVLPRLSTLQVLSLLRGIRKTPPDALVTLSSSQGWQRCCMLSGKCAGGDHWHSAIRRTSGVRAYALL